MAVDTKLLTVEEFAEMDPDGFAYELHDGVLVSMPPPGFQHAVIVAKLIAALQAVVSAGNLGVIAGNGGFLLRRHPDSVLAPDIAFLAISRMLNLDEPGYPETPPDLVIEVVSPSDRAADVHDKIGRYLHAGVPLVIAVWPVNRTVSLSTPDGLTRTLNEADVLTTAPALSGFSMPVADIFR